MITLSGYGDEISPDLEVQMDVLDQEGIRYIDLRSVNNKNVLEWTDKEMIQIKKRLDERGFKVHSISTPIGKSSITEDFTPRIKEFMRAVELAKYLNTPIIRIFSFYPPKKKNPWDYRDEVVKRIRQLTRIAEREGIILMHENEKLIFGDNGERIRYIMESIGSPHLRLASDPANFVQSKVLPMTDAYPYVEPYIAWVQIKDALINTGKVVPAGEGDGQIRILLRELKKKNYSGFISIESHLQPEGKYAGFSKPQLFVVAARSTKKLLEEAGLYPKIFKTGNTDYPPVQTGPASQKSTCPPLKITEYLDHWIPLVPLEQMVEKDYDVLIVGSGAGGGAVTWRICEQWKNNGKQIGVIEAGGLLLSTNAQNISTLTGARFEQFIFNPEISIPRYYPEFPAARQVFALGGRTLIWDVNTPRMHASVFKDWPVSHKEMEYYYNIAERVMHVTQAYSRESPITQILLERLWKSGFSEATETPRALNLNPINNGKINSDVYFSSIVFLAEAFRWRSFDLAVNARAVRILMERGKAIGIEVMDREHKRYVLKAKNIVLAGSTFETPRLLLHSGIGGPAVGHYLMDHAAMKAVATVKRKEFPQSFGPLWILIPQTDHRPYQFLISSARSTEDEIEIVIRGYGSVEPRYENRISLDAKRKDEFGVPELQVHYSYTPQDKETISGVASVMKQVLSGLRVSSILQEICLRPPGDDHHESGTCRMGNDPYTSATNHYGKLHGISGLYVADNSVLPSLAAANPTLTTVALAMRTADYISGNRQG